MQAIRAYALCGAAVAAIATWAFLQFPGLLIWCAFIGWAGFLHSGGDRATIVPTVVCMMFGVFMAWMFAVIIASSYISLPLPAAAAVLVALMAPVIILISQIPLLGIVPASFYGFACCFAFLAQTVGKFTMQSLTTVSTDHVLLVVPLSLAIGVGLGYLQTLLAQLLIRSGATSAPAKAAGQITPN